MFLANLCSTSDEEIILDKLIIKSSQASGTSGAFIRFKTPFPNKCLFVSLTDLGVNSASIMLQGLNGTPTKEGFNFVTKSSGEDTFTYVAIGY